jgi:hypothetical protein
VYTYKDASHLNIAGELRTQAELDALPSDLAASVGQPAANQLIRVRVAVPATTSPGGA